MIIKRNAISINISIFFENNFKIFFCIIKIINMDY